MNALKAGLRLTLAPRFHTAVAWTERLRINSGSERRNGVVVPRTDWRLPTEAELELLLTTDDPATVRGFPPEALSLLGIPEHLRREWWDRAGPEIAEGSFAGPGSQRFAASLRAYFEFKHWPLPPAAACDVVLSQPGQPLLQFATPGGGRIDCLINLGDEAAELHFVNLLPSDCQDVLDVRGQIQPDWQDRFFERLPDYPLVRMQLLVGEGIRLPDCELLCNGSTEGKTDLDVMLVIRGG